MKMLIDFLDYIVDNEPILWIFIIAVGLLIAALI